MISETCPKLQRIEMAEETGASQYDPRMNGWNKE